MVGGDPPRKGPGHTYAEPGTGQKKKGSAQSRTERTKQFKKKDNLKEEKQDGTFPPLDADRP